MDLKIYPEWIESTVRRFPPELSLLLASSRLSPEGPRLLQIENLLKGPVDWKLFLEMAFCHRVFPAVQRNFAQLANPRIPADVLKALENRQRQNVRKMLGLSAELARLTQLFEQSNIRSISLKGPVLGHQIYPDVSCRTSHDLDFLICREDIPKAEEIFLSQGYRPQLGIQMSSQQKKCYQNQFHHLNFYHGERKILAELHWQLIREPNDLDLPFDELWNRRHWVQFAGASVATIPPEENLLYLCVHGARHAWIRLRWLCDIAELLARDDAANWPQVASIAKRLGVERFLAQGAALSHILFDVPAPKPVADVAALDKTLTQTLPLALSIILMRSIGASESPMSPLYLARKRFSLMICGSLSDKLSYVLGELACPPTDWREGWLSGVLFPLQHLFRPILWAKRRYFSKQDE